MIAVFKNNFLNRHSPSPSTTAAATTSTTTTITSSGTNVNANFDNTSIIASTPIDLSTNVPQCQLPQQTIVVNSQPTRNNCQTTSRIIDHQPLTSLSASSSVRRRSSAYSRDSGIISAPISPNSVIDPFSVDYTLYNACVRASGEQSLINNNHCHCHHSDVNNNNNSVKHSSLSSPSAATTTITSATISSGSLLINRPRSRSSSASTMARVFDMFRGRSNSIATEQPQINCHSNNNNISYRNRRNNKSVSAKNFFFLNSKKSVFVCVWVFVDNSGSWNFCRIFFLVSYIFLIILNFREAQNLFMEKKLKKKC